MSHHTTVVNVQNTNIYINSVNAARKKAGLQPLPPGTTVSKATQQLEKMLVNLVNKDWGTQYPDVESAGSDFGFMYPTSELEPGQAPRCVVQQLALDFRNWQLPGTGGTARQIAQTITEELSAQGGVLGTQHGATSINSNEQIDWLVGYASVNISDDTNGYVYVFQAGLEI
ncbi:MAG: hypothetical protein AAGC60_21465 [Acidobacteriota bacterium]